jgi:hypothetical protein
MPSKPKQVTRVGGFGANRELAREQGLKRMASMTPEERKANARKAIAARWAKYREEKGREK